MFELIPFILGGGDGISKALGGLFGGSPEDTSTTGFTSFLNSEKSLPYYPTKAEMFAAALSGGWEGRIVTAIGSYNQNNGTFSGAGDDWKQVVVGINPITIESFKGAGQKFTLRSSISAMSPSVMNTGSGSQAASKNAGLIEIGSNNNNPVFFLVLLGLLFVFGKKLIGR
jgi:hypothetical protein